MQFWKQDGELEIVKFWLPHFVFMISLYIAIPVISSFLFWPGGNRDCQILSQQQILQRVPKLGNHRQENMTRISQLIDWLWLDWLWLFMAMWQPTASENRGLQKKVR